jgi:hypothetical protein
MLRKILIALHLIGAALSIALLVSTFVAKGLITSKAREIAIEKSRGLSDPLVVNLEETLERPVLGKLIPGRIRGRLEAELSDYKANPDDWMSRLAKSGADRAKAFDFPELEQPLARKAVENLVQGFSNLKEHLEESYRGLILDLRLFAATNLVAFLVAASLAWVARTPRAQHWLLAYSFVMLPMIGISIAFYLDRNWTWSLLRNDYMGWSYPVVMGVVTLYVLLVEVTPQLFFSRHSVSDSSRES